MGDLETFLNHRYQVLEATEGITHKQSQSTTRATHRFTFTKPKPIYINKNSSINCHMTVKKCDLCDKLHPIYFCEKFKSLSIPDREKEVKRIGLCFNCLNATDHQSQECKAGSCKLCGKKHNTLLHYTKDKTENNIPKHSTSTSITEHPKQVMIVRPQTLDHVDCFLFQNFRRLN